MLASSTNNSGFATPEDIYCVIFTVGVFNFFMTNYPKGYYEISNYSYITFDITDFHYKWELIKTDEKPRKKTVI